MDGKNRWAWLPAMMPGVARLMAEKREALGDAHVNECWRRGVVQGEPGWLFAWEGPISIGTTTDTQLLGLFASLPGGQRKAMLVLANVDGTADTGAGR